MSFFQNPFVDEFRGNLVLGDRQHIPTFVIKGNAGRAEEYVVSWNAGPYDLSGNDRDGHQTRYLTLSYSLYNTGNWAFLTIDITSTASSMSAVQSSDIVSALVANEIFNSRFYAFIDNNALIKGNPPALFIKQRKPVTEFKFHVVNGKAESVLGFNTRAGVAQLPSYFARHTIANRFNYADSQGKLIQLNPTSSDVDIDLINNAVDYKGTSLGYNAASPELDWQLLTGRSGIFNFQSITVDASDRITQIIEYPAGAIAGDFGRKTNYVYSGMNNNPSQITEIPYTLTSADLVTPTDAITAGTTQSAPMLGGARGAGSVGL